MYQGRRQATSSSDRSGRWPPNATSGKLSTMRAPHRYFGSRIVYFLSISFFATAAAVALLLATGYTIDWRQATLTKTGLLVLDSTPRGATVSINGKDSGKRTGTRLKLTPNSYKVAVAKPGSLPWEKDVLVEEGRAVIEDEIVLFADPPPSRELSAVGVVGRAMAPNNRQLAYLSRDQSELKLWLTNLSNDQPPTKLATLPEAYANPSSLTFSNDSTRLAISTASETTVLTAGAERLAQLPVGGNILFSPGQNDSLITESPGQVQTLTLATNTRLPLESNVLTWTMSHDALYLTLADGVLVRRDLRVGSRKTFNAAEPLTELRATPAADALFGRSASGALYTIDDNQIVVVAQTVERYALSQNGDGVAYTDQRELKTWERREKQTTLVTRFTDSPGDLALLPNTTYLLFTKAGALHAIAGDGSNDHVLAPAGAPPILLPSNDSAVVLDGATGRLSLLTIVAK